MELPGCPRHGLTLQSKARPGSLLDRDAAARLRHRTGRRCGEIGGRAGNGHDAGVDEPHETVIVQIDDRNQPFDRPAPEIPRVRRVEADDVVESLVEAAGFVPGSERHADDVLVALDPALPHRRLPVLARKDDAACGRPFL